MPPFLPRKRLASPSPQPESSESGEKRGRGRGRGQGKAASSTPRKSTLFDDLDAGTSSKGSKHSAERTKAALERLAATDEDESSLSSLSDDDFEDVPNAKRQKIVPESDSEDEDIEFEDVETNFASVPSGPVPSGDLELTLTKDTRISLTNPLGVKKGPSKIERQIRMATHQAHVQMLMWHNAIRNSWLCDKEVQQILTKHLTPVAQKEIEKWRRRSGLEVKGDEVPKGKGKGKAKNVGGTKAGVRSSRVWAQPAQRLEAGKADMSHGDPLFKLLDFLSKFWRQIFTITTPGLRKRGYMSLERLDEETKSYNSDAHDAERHGERVKSIREFRECARTLEGSRDVGAQLFTALLRAIGIETRMVASLQPAGFGWNKNEEAAAKKEKKVKDTLIEENDESDDEQDASEMDDPEPPINPSKGGKGKAKIVRTQALKSGKRTSRGNGLKDAPIDLSESEAEEEAMTSDEEDDSVIDVTPTRKRSKPSKPYDKDLLFPHYWSEVLSPLTRSYTPVDALVIRAVAINDDLVGKFEPRGAKAEKAKQVIAYVVGHSSDGTAKDVTTRYLKRHVWPGRTKGNRFPVEKVPVYNHKGKIKRYEEYDWFKTVMSGYLRGSHNSPRTEVDDHEDITDLKVVKPEKKEVKEGEETLQSYKSSAEYVLERFLRREEAILPTAKHVKMFTVKGKGNNTTEEKVFLRKNVVSCKSIETWHKEGRAPLPGEEPMKRVPYRAATTNRKRELAEAEHASGEKMLQGLYSRDQTDWIIPPPIENGVIPKNSYGNMDVYVQSMVPDGAVHIPRRGTMKICKRLGIDYAEAVTGFEFGARMAIPIITGVVVAVENLELVMEEWEKDERERVRKEDEKRTKAAIGMWRKMLMGMRIVERVREEYGDVVGNEIDTFNPWTNRNGKSKKTPKDEEARRRIMELREEDMAGGFLPEGHDEEEARHASSFFPVAHDDDEDVQGGGFIVEGHEEPANQASTDSTPQSLLSNVKMQFNSGPDEDTEKEEDLNEGRNPPEEVASSPEPEIKIVPNKRRGRPPKKVSIEPKPKSNNSDDEDNDQGEDEELEIREVKKKAAPARVNSRTTKKAPTPKLTRKRKRKIADTEDEEDDNEESEEESEVEVFKKKGLASKRRATIPARPAGSTRKTPRRNAARRSETALKSHYFKQSDDDDNDHDED